MRRVDVELSHLLRMGSRVLRRTGGGPELLVQFITSSCDCHCAHCFDWRRRGPETESRDLEAWELERIARSLPRLYFVILTGGEPFLRPDLCEITLAYARHARPRLIAIPTNGGRPEAIREAVARVMRELPPAVSLSINVSLDGVGDLHDEIRGRPGQFERATETIRGLQADARRDPRLSVGVVTVMSAQNQDTIHEVMSYVLDDLEVPIWAPFLVRGEPRDPAVGNVSLERYEEVARALEERIRERRYPGYSGFIGARLNTAKNVVRRETILRTVREGRRIVPCAAGRQAAVVYADGSVYPCELLDRPMGNLRDFDYQWRALWRSAAARAARDTVDGAACACTHENILTTSVAFAPRQWPALLAWTLALRR
jgi:MoaA/NifB/PqqE/SkfB family radical SAM enzyme